MAAENLLQMVATNFMWAIDNLVRIVGPVSSTGCALHTSSHSPPNNHHLLLHHSSWCSNPKSTLLYMTGACSSPTRSGHRVFVCVHQPHSDSSPPSSRRWSLRCCSDVSYYYLVLFFGLFSLSSLLPYYLPLLPLLHHSNRHEVFVLLFWLLGATCTLIELAAIQMSKRPTNID